MTASGQKGELLVGYQRAALLGSWQLSSTVKAGQLKVSVTGQLGETNPFWIERRPLTLRLTLGQFVWEWPNAAIRLFEDNRTFEFLAHTKPVKFRC